MRRNYTKLLRKHGVRISTDQVAKMCWEVHCELCKRWSAERVAREETKLPFCDKVNERIAAKQGGHKVNVPPDVLLGLHACRNQKHGVPPRVGPMPPHGRP
jgi:hypothetical protein